jgi:hypothetical protein
MGISPYKMVCGTPLHLPLELQHKTFWEIKQLNFDFKTAGEKRILDIQLLEEWRDEAYENAKLFKERLNIRHAKRIQKREFKEGDHVLLLNSHFRFYAGKLVSKWGRPFVTAPEP